ncbi:Asp23/Gls24 family envelope stress response protein [Amycolatopsis sacchari]|uniref:Asp23/Gls24 family envelope stress response protein n=1 Tax=Amycolatopsis sacchari TaxID=115433 RepID=UPI003D73F4BA
MALNPTTQGYQLPCGRDVEQVWEDLDHPGDHDLTCPHCRSARESLVLLREVTGDLAAEDTQPPAGLTSRIMAAVRADIRRRDLVDLPATEPGTVRISVPTAAAILRFAADTVEGVQARHCRVRLDDSGAVVELSIAIARSGFSPEAIEQVRERVAAAAHARIGWPVTTVHLTVTDIVEP